MLSQGVFGDCCKLLENQCFAVCCATQLILVSDVAGFMTYLLSAASLTKTTFLFHLSLFQRSTPILRNQIHQIQRGQNCRFNKLKIRRSTNLHRCMYLRTTIKAKRKYSYATSLFMQQCSDVDPLTATSTNTVATSKK